MRNCRPKFNAIPDYDNKERLEKVKEEINQIWDKEEAKIEKELKHDYENQLSPR